MAARDGLSDLASNQEQMAHTFSLRIVMIGVVIRATKVTNRDCKILDVLNDDLTREKPRAKVERCDTPYR